MGKIVRSHKRMRSMRRHHNRLTLPRKPDADATGLGEQARIKGLDGMRIDGAVFGVPFEQRRDVLGNARVKKIGRASCRERV